MDRHLTLKIKDSSEGPEVLYHYGIHQCIIQFQIGVNPEYSRKRT